MLVVAAQLALVLAPSSSATNDTIVRLIVAVTVASIVGLFGGVIVALYYLLLVFNSPLPSSERTFWVVVLVLFLPVGVLFFWYRVIWKGMDIVAATHKL